MFFICSELRTASTMEVLDLQEHAWFFTPSGFSVPQMQGGVKDDSDSEHTFIGGPLAEMPSPGHTELKNPMDADKASIYRYILFVFTRANPLPRCKAGSVPD